MAAASSESLRKKLLRDGKLQASASTKLRVVTNSSVNRSGGSYNDNCLQGSCLLNSSLDVLNGFSVWPYAFLTDLKEANRSIGTGDTTNNCRRFCWFRDPEDPSTLTDLMLNVSMYGDQSRVLGTYSARVWTLLPATLLSAWRLLPSFAATCMSMMEASWLPPRRSLRKSSLSSPLPCSAIASM